MGEPRAVFPAGPFGRAIGLSTFVSVGNATQSFSRLLDEVVRLEATLPQPVIVQHGQTPFKSDACQIIQFLAMSEFERIVAEAELLILHAGAGSVIHAVHAGKVPVVMPRRSAYGEHVDDHQIEFAEALAAASRVVLADDAPDLAKAVQRAIDIQRGGITIVEPSTMLRLVGETLFNYERLFS